MKKQSCRYTQKLSAYLDGELSGSEMDHVRMHTGECPVCRSCLEKLESAKALMLEMPEIAPSHDFDARFQEKVAALSASGAPERTFQNTGRPESGVFDLLRTYLFSAWRPYALGAAAAGALAFLIFTGNMDNGLAVDEIFLAENLEILQEYEILADLEFFEYLDTIETMKPDS